MIKNTSSFRRGVGVARRDWQDGEYDAALEKVSRLLLAWPGNALLLVMWADLVQLQEAEQGPALEEVRQAYQQAAELDPESPAALLELGNFLFQVEDDAEASLKPYEKAISLCKRFLVEAALGKAKALDELGRESEAAACLADILVWTHRLNGAGNKVVSTILAEIKGLRRVD